MATRKSGVTLTDLQFTILREAVTLARERQVQSVATLRAMLLRRWPRKPKSVTAALQFWADHERSKAR